MRSSRVFLITSSYIQVCLLHTILYHFSLSRFINIKAGRMVFSTFVLFLTLMVVTECSGLPENHDIVNELTKAVQRLEAKIAETEARIYEEMTMIHGTGSRRDKEMKQMKQESNEAIADLSEAMHRLESKFAETEMKKDGEMTQTKKKNAEMMAELTDKVQSQVADIDVRNAKFDEFIEKQGKPYNNSIYLIFW